MAKEIITKEDQLPADLLDEITASAGEGTVLTVLRCRSRLFGLYKLCLHRLKRRTLVSSKEQTKGMLLIL